MNVCQAFMSCAELSKNFLATFLHLIGSGAYGGIYSDTLTIGTLSASGVSFGWFYEARQGKT